MAGDMVIVVKGLDELQKALGKMGSNWQDYAGTALGKGLAVLESDAKIEAPVDTGRLRSSIGSQVVRGLGSEIVGKVGSAVEYASYQEFGTRYQPGKAFLRPSLEKNLDRVIKLLEQGIEEILRRLRLKP